MLNALEQVRQRSRSSYLRLTSKRVDQALFPLPDDPVERERLRIRVLQGAYPLVSRSSEEGYRPGDNVVHIMTCGAMIPEAVAASEELLREGVYANIINITGLGPLYRTYQDGVRSAVGGNATEPFMSDVIPPKERTAPIVTVADAHPHSLAWLGGALGTKTIPLGVTEFGQSGDRSELYREYGIDVDSIIAACFTALEI